jgi:hypothetical protein
MTTTLNDVAKKKQAEQQAAVELVRMARAQGPSLSTRRPTMGRAPHEQSGGSRQHRRSERPVDLTTRKVANISGQVRPRHGHDLGLTRKSQLR